MSMKIEFSDGAVLQSGPLDHGVQLLLSRDVFDNLRNALASLAIIEGKQGNVDLANDLLWLEAKLQEAVITE